MRRCGLLVLHISIHNLHELRAVYRLCQLIDPIYRLLLLAIVEEYTVSSTNLGKAPFTTDGLSAAASGIAVVSVAIQLIESVSSIKRFFRNLKDAPKELQRLLDLLDQFQELLENVKAVLDEERNSDAGVSNYPILTRAVQNCRNQVQMLEDFVSDINGSKKSSKMSSKWSSFRLNAMRHEILELENRILNALHLLNSGIAVTLMRTWYVLNNQQNLKHYLLIVNFATVIVSPGTLTSQLLQKILAKKLRWSVQKSQQ
jgi:cell fate (sporulation/competence/biofilm development) regulator YlbF (YheA/YmcA/DUF963 family)